MNLFITPLKRQSAMYSPKSMDVHLSSHIGIEFLVYGIVNMCQQTFCANGARGL